MLLDQILFNKDEILSIFKKYDARNVGIFGSVAKGEETEISDIDFVADFTADVIVDLRKELSTLLRREIDLATWDALRYNKYKALDEVIML
ncbi:DNA polymerase subunit beta [Bacillus cereus]|nr:DNA polymerase subunit beta [Bacillus cereus]